MFSRKRLLVSLAILLLIPLVLLLGGCLGGKPMAYISATPMNGPAPLAVNFSGNPYGCVTYQWNFGDGTSGTGQYPVHIYPQPGIYVATLVVTKQDLFCGSTSSEPVQITITVSVKPVLKINSIDLDSLPVCNNIPIRVSATIQHTHKIVAYNWTSSDGHYSADVSTTFTFGAAGAKTLTLTVTDELGQTATKSKSFTVDNCCDQCHPPCLPEDICIRLNPRIEENFQVCEIYTICVNFEDCPCHPCDIEQVATTGVDPQGIHPTPCGWWINWTVEKYEQIGCCDEAYVSADPEYYDSWTEGPNKECLKIKFLRGGNYRLVADFYLNGKWITTADGYYTVYGS